MLIEASDPNANWLEALRLWEKIANWIHYKTSESDLRQQLQTMLIYLWNEKDWLKSQYPMRTVEIERAINAPTTLSVIGDHANIAKHRRLTKKTRSQMKQTNYYGKVTVGGRTSRRMFYIDLGNGKHADILAILRQALDEMGKLRFQLRSEKAQDDVEVRSMHKSREIKPGDWITVGKTDCVVSIVYPQDSPFGVCQAVFNKHKPTTHDVAWDGEKWFFPERPDFGGYGRDSDPYVQKLKRGRRA